MKRLLLLLALGACMAAPDAPPPESFRDRGVPIASQVNVGLEDLDGSWFVRGTIGDFSLRQSIHFNLDTMGMRVRPDIPPMTTEGGQGENSVSVNFIIHEILGFDQGRFDAVARTWVHYSIDELIGEPTLSYWILWADADRRTMAIGTPDGTFGFILDREREGGEDRIAAARDIMEWMGYRVDEMETR